MPEAAAVYFPNPSTARLNMPPHIMEVHNPHKTTKTILIGTSVFKTGKVMVEVIGEKIANKINIKPKSETVIKIGRAHV